MVNFIIPVVVMIIIIYGLIKKVDLFDTFLAGVKEGLETSINLFPTIFAMLLAITMLTSSNIISNFSSLLSPLLSHLGFPSDLLPLALLRPISGTSSLVILSDILKIHGPDSYIGHIASVMQGSTDTTIYIVSMYFASIGIKKTKYSLAVGLLADFFSVIFSVIMVRLFF